MTIIGIDPGPEHSGLCIIQVRETLNDVRIGWCGKIDTEQAIRVPLSHGFGEVHIAIESMQSYGSAFGKSSIDTCIVIGRMIQAFQGYQVFLYPRPTYGRWITGGGPVSDATIREALQTQFGGYSKGEPLHALKGASDKRSAFAVAKYHEAEMRSKGEIE